MFVKLYVIGGLKFVRNAAYWKKKETVALWVLFLLLFFVRLFCKHNYAILHNSSILTIGWLQIYNEFKLVCVRQIYFLLRQKYIIVAKAEWS